MSFLLGLIVTITVVSVACTANKNPCIDRNEINCTAVEQEYNTERKRCQEIFTPCMIKDLKCSVQEFCSDECRDIYHKILQCSNGTAHRLEYLNLYCAVSNDPNHQNSSCIDLLLTRLRNSQGVYGYDTRCQLEVRTNLSFPCMPTCRKKLEEYKNDCCSINLAIAKEMTPGQDNENLINIHNYRLWEHCDVKTSTEMCLAPSCPRLSMNTAPPPETAEGETGAALASTHHVNWFFFVTVPLLLYIS